MSLAATGDNIVNPQNHASTLDCGNNRLTLYRKGLPNTELGHVRDLAGSSVNANVARCARISIIVGSMLGAKLGHGPDDTDTTVLSEGARNNFHGLTDGHVGSLLNTLHLHTGPTKSNRHGHFSSTATGQKLGLIYHIPNDLHGILKVALNLIQHVLGPATEKDRAGLGILALLEEGEPLLSDLAHLEQTALGTDVGFLNFIGTADDGGTGGAGHAVVVGLAEATEGGDAGLGEVVLGQIGHALLGNDNVGLECCSVVDEEK